MPSAARAVGPATGASAGEGKSHQVPGGLESGTGLRKSQRRYGQEVRKGASGQSAQRLKDKRQ